MIKKAVLIFFLTSPVFGSASLTMGTPVVGTDGMTVTVTISGVSGSLSPSTAITGFSVHDSVSGFSFTVSSATSSGSTVTLSIAQPTVKDESGVTVSLATAGGSNLTDTGGNTPSASGNTNVTATNNTYWYAANGSLLQAACQNATSGLRNVINNYMAGVSFASPDSILRCNFTSTSVGLYWFQYSDNVALLQDGIQVGFSTATAGTVYSTSTMATGLSGMHMYEFVNLFSNQQNTDANQQVIILGAIKLDGSPTFGSKPAIRPFTASCGDSITAQAYLADSRDGMWWKQSRGLGNVDDQYIGYPGNNIVPTLAESCPHQTNYVSSATAVWLQGGRNDYVSGVPVGFGQYGTTTTVVGGTVKWLEGIEGNSHPPQKMFMEGILRISSDPNLTIYTNALLSATTFYNALSTTTVPVCFTDVVGWINPATDLEPDNIHPNPAGLTKMANNENPITGGLINGQSYAVTGPSSGSNGIKSSSFTVISSTGATFTGAASSTQTITLNDGSAGGTFTTSLGTSGLGPLTSTPTVATTSFTFTYTPSSNGVKTISFTNGQSCWVNPASLTYTVSGSSLTAIIYSDLAANLINNRSWIKNYPQYGLPWDTSGHWANSLDCTATSPNSGSITSCDWLEVSGPSTLSFGNVHGTTTTVTNVSSGTYVIQVTAHDTGGSAGISTQTIGAVACDANGVLIPGDPNFTNFFGPTMCLGRNPYGFADDRHMAAMVQRNIIYNSTQTVFSTFTLANPDFITNQPGTISYKFGGTGNAVGAAGTTITTGISASSSTIIVASTAAAVMDLSSFPTRIYIQASNSFGPYEEIRICSNTGLTLNVCYDGRGIDGTIGGISSLLPAQSWSVGARVGQGLMKGSGTQFLTTFAPAGAGPEGPVRYNTGTVSLTAGSPTLTGSGTLWSGNVSVGDVVNVSATHSSTPFTFVAYVSMVNSNTSITLSRNFPSDADSASGLTYSDIVPFFRYAVMRWGRLSPYSGTGQSAWTLTGCEDDTHCYFTTGSGMFAHDIPGFDGTTFTNQNYAFSDATLFFNYANQSPTGGINFYGENLAWLSMYERSGLQIARTMADQTSGNWLQHPTWNGGNSVGGSPLFTGGAFIGAVADYAMFGNISINDLRPWFANGSKIASEDCNAWDTRDSGYLSAEVYLGALYDPDTSSTNAPGGIPWKTYWRNFVGPGAGTVFARDTACKRSNGGVDTNSWAHAADWAPNTPVTLTNGSANVTGTGFSSALCLGDSSGTVTVIAGSDTIVAATGNFSTHAGAIIINGRFFQMLRTDSTHGRISVLWPDVSNTYGFMTTAPVLINDAGPFMAAYGQSNTDASLKQNYSCIYNSPTSLTLDRNFTGTSGANYQYQYTVAGYGQQPFMLGIKSTGMKYISTLDSTLGETYGSYAGAAAQWLHDYGINTENTTLYYGRVYGNCESGGVFTGTTQSMIWKTPTCSVQKLLPYIIEDEQLIQEAFSGLSLWYQNNPTVANKSFDDAAYCAIWCQTALNAPGITDNPNSVGNNYFMSNLTNLQLSLGKYPGQLFGMGFAASWPAIEATTSPPSTSVGSFNGNATFKGSALFKFQ